jgi:hypothetical protein
MPSFDVAWTRRAAHQWRKKNADEWVCEAVLVERVIVGDKPAIKVVCRLGTIGEDLLDDISAADNFWHGARRKLGRMQRLDRRDVDAIERLIAVKVARPRPTYPPATAAPAANPVRGAHSPLTGRALRAR